MKIDYKTAYENVLTANKMLEKEIERLSNIIKEVREAVETGISEDDYDGCVYNIKNILDKADKGE